MGGDEVERERRLVVGVEIGPVHRDEGLGTLADDLGHPRREQLPHDQALVAQEPVDLFDRMLGEQPASLSQRLANDRYRQRSTHHHTQGSIRERADTLCMEIIGECLPKIALYEL